MLFRRRRSRPKKPLKFILMKRSFRFIPAYAFSIDCGHKMAIYARVADSIAKVQT